MTNQGITGVHGISTRKVYPPRLLPADAVRSYRTFSPLPDDRGLRECGLRIGREASSTFFAIATKEKGSSLFNPQSEIRNPKSPGGYFLWHSLSIGLRRWPTR